MKNARRRGLLAAAAAAAAIGSLAWLSARQGKTVLLALDAEEVKLLCRNGKVSLDEFWERAAALGVGGVASSPVRLSDWIARGSVLDFSRAEVEKWKVLGLIAPGASVRPNTIWLKDKGLIEPLLAALSRAGVAAATSSAAGFHVVELLGAAPIDAAAITIGADPEASSWAAKHGLLVLSGGLQSQGGPASSLAAGSATPGARRRALYWRRHPAVLWRLSPSLDLEANLDLLREAAREFRSASSAPPAGGLPIPAPATGPLLALAAGFGSLLAVRAGLKVLAAAKPLVRGRAPQGSPVLELAAGLAGTAASASILGAFAGAFGAPDWPSGGRPPAWLLGLPLALGWLALYAAGWAQWRRALARPLSPLRLLKIAGLTILALWALAPSPARFDDASWLWWWPWRWSEVLIGYPALLCAYSFLSKKWDCPDCEESARLPDPRPWLVAGLLAPAGAILAHAHGGAPFAVLFAATAETAVAGSALGVLLLLGLRLFSLKRWGVYASVAKTGEEGQ